VRRALRAGEKASDAARALLLRLVVYSAYRLRATRSGVRRALLLAALASAAGARAEIFEFEGELTLEPLLPAIPPVRIEGAGVATLNGSGAGVALRTLSLAGGVAGTATVPVTDPVVSNGGIEALRMKARVGTGRLRPFQPPVAFPEPQLSSGELSVRGALKLCLFGSCGAGLDLPLYGATVNGDAGLGLDGLLPIAPLATIRHSLLGAPWTPGTASLAVRTEGGGEVSAVLSGFAHGPYSFTGSTALPGGELSLVTPLVFDSTGGAAVPPSGFARLTLRFVPEPRGLFALAPSIALLVLGARRRRRGGAS
jgi:hypothetical protein